MRYLISVVVFLFVTLISFAQQNDSVMCLPKVDVITLANKIKFLQDTVIWQKKYIRWQDTLISVQDTLIKSQKYRIGVCELQINNLENTINLADVENKRLREAIEMLTPKWYEDKWLWAGGAAVVTFLLIK